MLDNIHALIIDGYEEYLHAFYSVTSHAKTRFEARDWLGVEKQSLQRITLYKSKLGTVVRRVKRILKDQHQNDEIWIQLKRKYQEAIATRTDIEIAKTFFNSICRKVYGHIGAREDIMFVTDFIVHQPIPTSENSLRRYALDRDIRKVIRQIIDAYQFTAPFDNLDRDVHWITERLLQFLANSKGTHIEMLSGPFFRNKGAYLVGRLLLEGTYTPFIIPLLHTESGIFADTLILKQDTANIVFSFARSYFMVDSGIPSETIHFLQSIMPTKKTGDLYNAIGFNKHGKSVFYSELLQHLSHSQDTFITAPGIPGLVMAVFTLPTYPVVFKLIKDKIEPPKNTTRGLVRSKYRLVKMIDRVGRLADTHEFEHLILNKAYFSPSLLEYLLDVAPSIVHVEDSHVIIDHIYTERKLIPLNLFLENCTPKELEYVSIEYGNAIKQMAAANIFPGDMFLKNFGVSRLHRVIFYDYDEIGRLTDYHFREMPKAQSTEEIYASDPWFAVNEHDVFPEEFQHFLVGKEEMKEVFYREHSDLFTVSFWEEMQTLQKQGEMVDIFPYDRSTRFRDI